jgi:hypothetical protein
MLFGISQTLLCLSNPDGHPFFVSNSIFVTYVTRVRADMATVMANPTFTDGPLRRLIRVLITILKLKNLHKDPVTQASLLIFFLLTVAPSSETQLSYIWTTFFA